MIIQRREEEAQAKPNEEEGSESGGTEPSNEVDDEEDEQDEEIQRADKRKETGILWGGRELIELKNPDFKNINLIQVAMLR